MSEGVSETKSMKKKTPETCSYHIYLTKKKMDGYEYQYGRRGSIYMQVGGPNKPDRPTVQGENGSIIYETPYDYNPTEWVQSVINSVRDDGHKVHSVFSEMDVLRTYNDTYEWREAARWVKYEEVVEEGGKRWSKPHVASLSMQSLFDLRNALADGVILLDYDCHSLPQAVDKILDEWIEKGQLDSKLRAHMRDVSLKYHKHGHVKRNKSKGAKLGDIPDESPGGRRSSMVALPSTTSFGSYENGNGNGNLGTGTPSSPDLLSVPSDSNLNKYKPNTNFMRKIPKDAEVASVMVGEVDDLDKRLIAIVRLKEPRLFEQICEVNLPTKFLFFCYGPVGGSKQYMELGRCVGTMMVDDIFREVAYKGRTKEDILAGIDEFMEQVTVLPPGEWDPKIRIEPPTKTQSQEFRKSPSNHSFGGTGGGGGGSGAPFGDDDDHGGHGDDPSLEMSKIPFIGLVRDIKRKVPFYLSDFKDAVHIQCLASFIYVFLGTMTPNVTFGGLLGEATDQYMGVMECIFAAAVTGILFALFSGQPMNILGSTGPMLVLETIIFNLCKDNDWDFMPARFWVGMWTVLFILLIVIFNLSALVKYITRFTEESFATLIALIFIVEAFNKLFEIEKYSPVNFDPNGPIPTVCHCVHQNCTSDLISNTSYLYTSNYTCADYMDLDLSGLATNSCITQGGFYECGPKKYVGDVFFFSILLFLGTFSIAIALIDFKRTTVFPSMIRQRLSDFGVLIAILVMVGLDALVGIDTPKLTVPTEFKPTRPGRGWFVNPFSDKNPWWLYLAAAVPALLCTILIFLDQQITAVIVNRKENKLKKGVGYHLDMFIVAICVGLHSLLGLPWYVAATVSALAHINSLKKESECTAPGEKPTYLGVREQRVTALAIGVLSGLAVLITSVLKYIPMPVLYGVFFFMGFQALRGMQLVDRLFLFIQPVKYQPDLPYVRHVPLMRIHLFTFIQVLCLGILWAVKTIKAISIGFPLMVLATGVVRKMLECIYTQNELKWIDDLLPGKSANDKKEKSEVPYKTFSGNINNAYLNGSKDDVMSKPKFFVSEECDISERKNGQGNTKL